MGEDFGSPPLKKGFTMAKKVKKTKAKKIMPKILIGVPILAWTHEFATSFLEFWTDLMTYDSTKRVFHIGYKFAYRRPVHMAEEELAQFAIDAGCTHILLMDDDIYDVKAEDLLKLVDADKDVVGGIMHTNGFPHAMCAFRRYDTSKSVAEQPALKGPARLYEVPVDQRVGLQKVDLIPFAFTLIKTSVFKNMKKPWFKCDTVAPTDSWFADEALKKGLSYYAHFDVWLNHRGVTRENQAIYMQLGMLNAQQSKKGSIINLTPEEMKRHEILMECKLAAAEKDIKKREIANQAFFVKRDKAIGKPIKSANKGK